jgi:hypothetical protein
MTAAARAASLDTAWRLCIHTALYSWSILQLTAFPSTAWLDRRHVFAQQIPEDLVVPSRTYRWLPNEHRMSRLWQLHPQNQWVSLEPLTDLALWRQSWDRHILSWQWSVSDSLAQMIGTIEKRTAQIQGLWCGILIGRRLPPQSSSLLPVPGMSQRSPVICTVLHRALECLLGQGDSLRTSAITSEPECDLVREDNAIVQRRWEGYEPFRQLYLSYWLRYSSMQSMHSSNEGSAGILKSWRYQKPLLIQALLFENDISTDGNPLMRLFACKYMLQATA